MKTAAIIGIALALGLGIAIHNQPAELPLQETINETVEMEEIPMLAKIYDVPLDAELQNFINVVANYYEVDPALVVAVIEKESRFDQTAIGDGGESYGLMQIQPKWWKVEMEELGLTDLLDPYDNVQLGIYLLDKLLDEGLGTEWALMAYNGGVVYANSMTAQGKVSDYAKTIIERRDEMNVEV